MRIFIVVDSENRVTSYRFGDYEATDISADEIDITDSGVGPTNFISALYDTKKKQIVFDEVYDAKQQEIYNPPVHHAPAAPAYDPYAYTESEAAAAVQNALDAKAKEYNYDSVFTAATYAASTNPMFKADADAFIAWRDTVWVWAYGKLAQIQAGTLAKPPFNELLSDMPAFVAPVYPTANTP